MTTTSSFSAAAFNTENALYSWGDPQLRVEIRHIKNSLVLLCWTILAIFFLFMAVINVIDWRIFSYSSQLLPIMLGASIGLPALYMAWRTWKQRSDWVAIYGDGIRASMRGEQVALRWKDIESIQQNLQTIRVNLIPIKICYFYLKSKNGQNYTFGNSFKDIEIIGAMMQQQVTARLLPTMINRYESGERLNFSGVSIDTEGLYLKKKRLPWQALEKAVLQGDLLTFKQQGKRLRWGSLNANITPNIFVFVSLLRYLGKLS